MEENENRRKPWENEPISKEEWASNKAAVKAVIAANDGAIRRELKDCLANIIGRHPDPVIHSAKMAKILVEKNLLTAPDWHFRSTLTLDHFSTEELEDAYAAIKPKEEPKPRESTFNEDDYADGEDPF